VAEGWGASQRRTVVKRELHRTRPTTTVVQFKAYQARAQGATSKATVTAALRVSPGFTGWLRVSYPESVKRWSARKLPRTGQRIALKST
jgi:hypothetical protein